MGAVMESGPLSLGDGVCGGDDRGAGNWGINT